MKWTPDLIIVLIIVVGCFALLACGFDGDVKSILAIATGWACRTGYMANKVTKGEK
jgi:hypothetical protein